MTSSPIVEEIAMHASRALAVARTTRIEVEDLTDKLKTAVLAAEKNEARAQAWVDHAKENGCDLAGIIVASRPSLPLPNREPAGRVTVRFQDRSEISVCGVIYPTAAMALLAAARDGYLDTWMYGSSRWIRREAEDIADVIQAD